MCPTGTSLRLVNITSETTSDFRGAFEVIDVDHDGKISGEDLRSFYASFSGGGNNDEEQMIKAMITLADANKDGYVQYEEFEKVLKEKRSKVNGKEKEKDYVDEYDDCEMMEEVFKVMDKDGDGKLGVDDLKSYLTCAGIKVHDDEINAMIMLGCDNEGDVKDGVSFHGFLNILKFHELAS